MSNRSPSSDGDYDIPMVWHGIIESDASVGRKADDEVPVGGFERCDVLAAVMESEAHLPAAVSSGIALSLTFSFDAAVVPASLAQDVLEVLNALHECDKTLGGQGLDLDSSASQAGEGWLSLVLRPTDENGAGDRFQRMAEQLRCQIAPGSSETSTELNRNGRLAMVAGPLKRHNLSVEQIMLAHRQEPLLGPDNRFEEALAFVLKKNAELYRRLAQLPQLVDRI